MISTHTGRRHRVSEKADGTARTETDQKVICLEDEEAKFRSEFGDKAVKGITDEKQAKAAAELFKGEFKKLKNKFGKEVNGYVIDECDRKIYREICSCKYDAA